MSDKEQSSFSLQDELKATRQECQRLKSWIEQLEEELCAAHEQNADLETRIQSLSQMNSRLQIEKAELFTRVEMLRRGGGTSGEDPAVVTQVEKVRAELEAEVQKLAGRLEATRNRSSEELEALRKERDALATKVEELRHTLTDTRQVLAAERESAAEALAERLRLEQELEKQKSLIKDLERKSKEAETRAAKEDGGRAALAVRIEELEKELKQAYARAKQTITATEQQRKSVEAEFRETLESERERAAAKIAELNAEVERLRNELLEQRAHLQRWQEVTEQMYAADRERMAQALAEKEMLLEAMEMRLLNSPSLGFGVGVFSAEEEQAPTSSAVAPQVEEDLSLPGDLIIIDDSENGIAAARRLHELNFPVTVVAPSQELQQQLGRRKVPAAAINLAMPSAWDIARRVRLTPATAETPLFAYALAPEAKTGFWFGAVDFYVLSTDGIGAVQVIKRLAPQVKRVLAMSNDVNGISAIRAQLDAAKISTAFVLDGRQVLDMAPIIRPEVALVHLSPQCFDVFRGIGGLRSVEVSREIPILFLLDATAQPRDVAFFTAGVRMISERGKFKLDNLPSSLAVAFRPYCPSAPTHTST